MLRLVKRDETPFWLDIIPGVRMQFRPTTVTTIAIGRNEAGKAYRALPDGAGDDDREAAANVAMVTSIARAGLVAWEGVADTDGNAIGVSSEAVDRVLEEWPIFESVARQYVTPAFEMPLEGPAKAGAKSVRSGKAARR